MGTDAGGGRKIGRAAWREVGGPIRSGRRSGRESILGAGEVVGGAGSALRGTRTVRRAGLVRSEPETLSFCLLLKPRTNC